MSESINTSFYRVSGGTTIEETLTMAETYLSSKIADAITTTGYVSHSVSSFGVPRQTWTSEYPASESPWKVLRVIYKRKRTGKEDAVIIVTTYIVVALPEVPTE